MALESPNADRPNLVGSFKAMGGASELFDAEFLFDLDFFVPFVPPPTGTQIKYWAGSAWVAKPLKKWNGSAWVEATLKWWNGSAWVST